MLIEVDGEVVDVGGSMNVLTPSRSQQRRTSSMSPNSCLVQVEPWRVTQEAAAAAREVAAARTAMGVRRTEVPA
jgi:trimethylamine-N-oxide reductase (cytochrome c)